MQAGLGSPLGSAAPRGRAGDGDGQGRSAPASPLTASAVVLCQGKLLAPAWPLAREGSGAPHAAVQVLGEGLHKGCEGDVPLLPFSSPG